MDDLINGLKDFLGGSLDTLVEAFASILDFFNNILDWVVCIIRHALDWFVKAFVDFLTPLLNEVYSKFPELPTLFEGMSETLSYVAWWVPFDIIVPIMSSYWTFELYMIGIKLILKIVPGVK